MKRFWPRVAAVGCLISVLVGCGRAGNIHDAAKAGNVSEVKGLLKRDASLVNAKDEKGRTPLHYGIFRRNVAEVLLAKGADINARDSEGKTPLMWTMQTSYKLKDTVVLIVDTASIRKGEEGKNPLAGTPFALLAPTKVLNFNGKEMVEFLLDKGADLNIQANDGHTVLTLATVNARTDLVQLLVAKTAASTEGQSKLVTALIEADARGDKKTAAILLVHVTEVSVRDKAGKTPLHNAAERGCTTIAEFFLKRGADINAKDKGGRTPLHMAAKSGSIGTIKLLLANGADPNAKDVLGNTPVDLAEYPKVAEAIRQGPAGGLRQ